MRFTTLFCLALCIAATVAFRSHYDGPKRIASFFLGSNGICASGVGGAAPGSGTTHD